MKLLKLRKLLAKESLCRARKRIRNALKQSANECKDALSEIENAHTVQREGWVSVPVEPTEEMIAALKSALKEWKSDEECYKAMLSAAQTDTE